MKIFANENLFEPIIDYFVIMYLCAVFLNDFHEFATYFIALVYHDDFSICRELPNEVSKGITE